MNPSPALSTVHADVCVIGAGPHGLAITLELAARAPFLDVVAVDPSGQWLTTWHDQMARAEIPTLRSPIVHSPSTDASALADHCHRHGLPSSGLPYDIPTVEAFAHFCDSLTDPSRLDPPIAANVRRVARSADLVAVETDNERILANHLIVASNPHRRNIPDWVLPLLGQQPGCIEHAENVDLGSLAPQSLVDENVLIIGGGLSAGHLATGAITRGARVTMITRRPLTTRSFDTDPGWLGPKFLDGFDAEPDPAVRLRAALDARGGGTIPPWMGKHLTHLESDEPLTIYEGVDVVAASFIPNAQCRLALSNGETVDADRLWLATGTTPDIAALGYLDEIVADTPVVDGYPVLNNDLQLDGHPIHMMGRLATLTLGPACGNLWGAQRASERIVRAIAPTNYSSEIAEVISESASS